MTSRAQLTLDGDRNKQMAHEWIDAAPLGTRVVFKGPRRTQAQSDKMWAMLTEVATQLPWHGQRLKADDWKTIFIAGLKRELKMVPNLDNTAFVDLGKSSSALSKSEMSDLIELIYAFGAEHGVKFADPHQEFPQQ